MTINIWSFDQGEAYFTCVISSWFFRHTKLTAVMVIVVLKYVWYYELCSPTVSGDKPRFLYSVFYYIKVDCETDKSEIFEYHPALLYTSIVTRTRIMWQSYQMPQNCYYTIQNMSQYSPNQVQNAINNWLKSETELDQIATQDSQKYQGRMFVEWKHYQLPYPQKYSSALIYATFIYLFI